MARSVIITAYGSPEDRLRLEAISKLEEKSSSQWLIDLIRKRYAEIYGGTHPEQVIKK
jgi:hypothetical protein